jgi:hypothetical protein
MNERSPDYPPPGYRHEWRTDFDWDLAGCFEQV